MADTAPPDWRPFRVSLNYVDAELEAYQRIAAAARRRWVGRHDWLAYLGSVVAGFAGVAIAVWTGAIDRDHAGLIGIIVCAGFWLGLLAPGLLSSRRTAARGRAEFRSRWDGSQLLASPAGLALRMPHRRAVYGRAAIEAVTFDRQLMLFWVAPYQPVAVPLRLLRGDQIDRLLTFQRGAGGAPARPANRPPAAPSLP